MNIISAYTAKQAVEDGVLVNVPDDLRKQAGFKIPVRITNTIHSLCTPPKSNKIQSYTGRLWDVLFLASYAIRKAKNDHMCTFKVKLGRKIHELWACMDGTIGPAIHIMKPEDY